MNELRATVKNIEQVDDLNLVEFKFNETTLTMMSLHLKNVFVGVKVVLSVNSSHVMLAKSYDKNMSVSNAFEAKIVDIEYGQLLTAIKVLSGESVISSITTTKLAKKLDFKVDDKVSVLIKASQLAIKEVLND